MDNFSFFNGNKSSSPSVGSETRFRKHSDQERQIKALVLDASKPEAAIGSDTFSQLLRQSFVENHFPSTDKKPLDAQGHFDTILNRNTSQRSSAFPHVEFHNSFDLMNKQNFINLEKANFQGNDDHLINFNPQINRSTVGNPINNSDDFQINSVNSSDKMEDLDDIQKTLNGSSEDLRKDIQTLKEKIEELEKQKLSKEQKKLNESLHKLLSYLENIYAILQGFQKFLSESKSESELLNKEAGVATLFNRDSLGLTLKEFLKEIKENGLLQKLHLFMKELKSADVNNAADLNRALQKNNLDLDGLLALLKKKPGDQDISDKISQRLQKEAGDSDKSNRFLNDKSDAKTFLLKQGGSASESMRHSSLIERERSSAEHLNAIRKQSSSASQKGIVQAAEAGIKMNNNSQTQLNFSMSGDNTQDDATEAGMKNILNNQLKDVSSVQDKKGISSFQSALNQRFSPAEAKQIIDQIVRQAQLQRIQSGRFQFNASLRPQWLGRVNLQLHFDHGSMVGKFLVETEALRDLLQQHLALLKKELNQAGLQIEQFEVVYREKQDQRSGESYQDKKERLALSARSKNFIKNQKQLTDAETIGSITARGSITSIDLRG